MTKKERLVGLGSLEQILKYCEKKKIMIENHLNLGKREKLRKIV